MSKLPKVLKATTSKQLKLDKILTPTRSRSRSPSMEASPPKKKPASRLVSEDESMDAKSSSTTASPVPAKAFPLFKSEPKTEDTTTASALVDEIAKKRLKLYESVDAFRFNKKRVRVLSETREIPENSNGLVYWMSRDQRVQDNWALLYAQKLALKQKLPLYVCFCLVPTFLNATYRHYYFMLEGLKEVEKELNELNIPFFLLLGKASERLPTFVKENSIGGVICDFSPLRISLQWLDEMKKNLPENIPFAQVDAHNIVPCWEASDKLEYAARTIRNKINSRLEDFLTEYPPLVKHPHDPKIKSHTAVDWEACYASLKCDTSVKAVDWAKPGYTAGIKILEEFIKTRLKGYDQDRNDPNKNGLSNLSPWYHFGHISVQRCIVEVKKYASKCPDSVKAYLEEAIVRRELADNFCYYQPNYDKLEGAYDWARKTLADHAKDKRPSVYSLEQLENAKTGDKLWNASQIQMRVEGKMHGFMRMYWAKKILEWTESPEQALEYAIYLNDKYQLDGRDANGYVGCMWSICGIHDQGWAERAVFGKIRYMNYDGCKRKFDVDRYALKYNHKKDLM